MRAIKFRAWNKKESRYSLPFTWQSLLGDIAWYDICEVWLQYGDGGSDYWTLYAPYFDEDGWVLEQFTGLKDKHGVEIYEGDIIKYYWKSIWGDRQEVDVRYEVVFEDGAFQQRVDGQVDIWQDWTEIEVIGNINENPELLETGVRR